MVAAAPSDRGKLHASVVSTIEAQILSGELKIGERLPSEAELSRVFGISTRSVREGLQILETKGMVRRRHGERAEVVRDDVDQFLGSLAATVKTLFAKDAAYLVQLMDVRRMFELEVVGRLAAGEGALSQDVSTALRSLADATDFAQYAEADANFHRALVQSLGNEILSSVYGNLYALITDVIRLTSRVVLLSIRPFMPPSQRGMSRPVAHSSASISTTQPHIFSRRLTPPRNKDERPKWPTTITI